MFKCDSCKTFVITDYAEHLLAKLNYRGLASSFAKKSREVGEENLLHIYVQSIEHKKEIIGEPESRSSWFQS